MRSVEMCEIMTFWQIPGTPFSQHGLTFMPAWIGNHMPGKVWDEITYPFPNCNRWNLEMDK